MTLCWWSIVIFLCVLILNVRSEENAAFGPYTTRLERVAACRGPKRTDLAHAHVALVRRGGRGLLATNFTLDADVRLDMLRAIGYKVTKTDKNVVYKYQTKQPCEHLMLGPYVRAILNTSNCVLKKGSYALETDVEALTRMVLPKWFYGVYQTKATLCARDANVGCIFTEMAFYPNTNNNTNTNTNASDNS